MRIGDVIRKYRKEVGLTQEEMANRLGVTTPAVNKWENNNSNPDIELLAPIARLLHISLDTLLAFQEELTDAEIGNKVVEVSMLCESEGFDKAFERATDIVREYPNCNQLIWQMAILLDAYQLMNGILEEERFDEQISAWYERGLQDEKESMRRTAADSLFQMYCRKKQFEKAGEYLCYFSDNDPTKAIYQGKLYMEQGQQEQAYETFENVLMNQFQTMSMALSMMSHMALEQKDTALARYYAEHAGSLAKALEMGRYQEVMHLLQVVSVEQNVEETYRVVKDLLQNIDGIGDYQNAILFQHVQRNTVNEGVSIDLKSKLIASFQQEESFSYMKGYEPWEKLLSE